MMVHELLTQIFQSEALDVVLLHQSAAPQNAYVAGPS